MDYASLPDPTKDVAAMWLRQIPPDYLQQAGWIHANQQFHGIVMAARTYANQHYIEPGQAAAFFEGIVLALTVLERQAEVDRLQQLLGADS